MERTTPFTTPAVVATEETLALHKLLAHIAQELHVIAEQNDRVQDTLQSLMQRISLESSDMKSIQTLDLLSQKKRDLGVLIEGLAHLISETEAVPYSKINDSLKLEYMRSVLINGSDKQDVQNDADIGSVNLF